MAVLVAALLFSGCGGDESGDPQSDLTLAAQHAKNAGSVHAQANITLEPIEGEQGMGLNIQGDAWLDMNAQALEARFTVMGMELSLRYVDGTAYVEWGGEWYYLTDEAVADLGIGAIESLVKLLVNYPDLFSNVSEVEELGEKTVGDYECTQMRVTLDMEAITAMEPVQELAATMDVTPEEINDYLKESGLEITVSVQKDEPVIREVQIVAVIDLPDVGEIAGISLLPKRAHMDMLVIFPEYGVQVDVQPPADAKPFEGLF
jgi:hypothetical protein